MGNQHSRHGDYRSRYPPKHTYYHGPSTRRKHARPRDHGDEELEDGEYSRYPAFNPSHVQQPYAYAPVAPPPMSFAPPPPSAYPVIPPMPASTYTMAMPSAVPMPQPMMQMPVPQPMPTTMPASGSAPVIPPLPQTGIGTPFPMAPEPPVIPAMASSFYPPHRHGDYSASDSSSGSEDMQPVQPQPPSGQHGTRTFVFQRPQTLVFHNHPLPPPPEDIFDRSPNMRLLQDLRRPVEDVMKTKLTTAGYLISPVGTQTSREKKKRKGLFRAFSEKLTGKSKHDDAPTHVALPIIQPVMLPVQPNLVQPGVIPPPGYTYDPVYPTSGVVPPGEAIHGLRPNSAGTMSGFGTPAPPPPPKTPTPAPYSPRSHSPRPHSPRAHSPHSYNHRSHSPRPHSPHREPLRIEPNGYLADLTHLSPHPVHFGDRVFPTAMHALEAQRFVNTRPDVVDEIAACQTPDDVRAVVSRRVAHSQPDWEQIVLQKMDEVLYAKFAQHPHLRRLLLGTMDLPLQFCAQQDNFWGDGPLGQGANQLGKALERVRERLRHDGYQ